MFPPPHHHLSLTSRIIMKMAVEEGDFPLVSKLRQGGLQSWNECLKHHQVGGGKSFRVGEEAIHGVLEEDVRFVLVFPWVFSSREFSKQY